MVNEDNQFEEVMEDYVMSGFEIMKQFRGNVIEKSLQLDYLLDNIIANYFSKENKTKNDQFRSLILDSRFTTSFRKIKIFQELKLHKDPKFGDKFKGFSGRLLHFNEARDDFAHITRDTYYHEFDMRWKGKKEIRKLDTKFQKELENEFQYLIKSLLHIAMESGLLLNWSKYEEVYNKNT